VDIPGNIAGKKTIRRVFGRRGRSSAIGRTASRGSARELDLRRVTRGYFRRKKVWAISVATSTAGGSWTDQQPGDNFSRTATPAEQGGARREIWDGPRRRHLMARMGPTDISAGLKGIRS